MRGFFFLPSLAIFMNQVCPQGKSSYARQLQYSTVGFQVSGTRPGAHRRRTLLGHFAIFPSVGVVSHVFSGDEPECCPLHQTMRPFLVAPLSKDCLWLGLAANSAASHTQPSSCARPHMGRLGPYSPTNLLQELILSHTRMSPNFSRCHFAALSRTIVSHIQHPIVLALSQLLGLGTFIQYRVTSLIGSCADQGHII